MKKDEIVLKVTREDISNGIRNNPFECPIALAGNRSLNRGVAVARDFKVYPRWWEIFWKKSQYYIMPDNAKVFMTNFDRNLLVEPIIIVLEKVNKETS